MPVAGAIDNFLPIVYGDDLWSNMHSIDLGLQFQDFAYTIDSSLESLTFAFASTDYGEVVGIDSVRIWGDPITPIPEPSTLLLLGSASLFGAAFRKRLSK